MKRIFLLCSAWVYAFAYYSNENIANELKRISLQHNIDKRVLYTLAKIESNFNPLIISFTSSHTNFNFTNLKKSVSKYKNRYLITFQGEEKALKEALKLLIQQNISVDVGLMQINSVNFKENEIENIFKPSFNISKSAFILEQCKKAKQRLKPSIECYNKGLKKSSSFEYYERFKESFLRDFGGL